MTCPAQQPQAPQGATTLFSSFYGFIVELISMEAQGCGIVFVCCLLGGGQEGINCTFLPGKFFCGE